MLYGEKEALFSPRLLPERSYLYYKYPQISNERSIEFYFPILENIEISESQRPNLGVYDLLGRAGNLFSYHGSKSREFSLKFFITLPNIIDHINNVGLNSQFSDSFRYFYSERDAEKRKFSVQADRDQSEAAGWLASPVGVDIGNSYGVNYYQQSLSQYDSFLPPKSASDSLLEKLSQFTNALKIPVFENPAQILNLFKKERPKVLKNAISYFMLLINVVRTATVNNSSNTSLSPPTIYINHGTMYNNIPCVCTNYNLRIVSENGYELKNMNPRRVEVTMNLSENRTGNFGEFIPWTTVKNDLATAENLTGWESIINHRTMDPWNSTFGEYERDLVNVAAWEKQEEEERRRIEESVQDARNRARSLQTIFNTGEEGLGTLVNPYAIDRDNEYNTQNQGTTRPPEEQIERNTFIDMNSLGTPPMGDSLAVNIPLPGDIPNPSRGINPLDPNALTRGLPISPPPERAVQNQASPYTSDQPLRLEGFTNSPPLIIESGPPRGDTLDPNYFNRNLPIEPQPERRLRNQ